MAKVDQEFGKVVKCFHFQLWLSANETMSLVLLVALKKPFAILSMGLSL